MSEDVLFDVDDTGVAVLTLNRPEVRNTISASGGIIEALDNSYKRCDLDDDIRVIVVTGAGEMFSAGADMSGGGDTFDSAVLPSEYESCPLHAWDLRKPVIAACNGHAVGAGLSLAMQADIRVFANEGKYGFPQSRRGVVADFAIEYVLPRIVGFERAFELLVRASLLQGEEAVSWGLASRSVPREQVLDTALEIARDIAVNCAPLAVGLHKRLLWQGLDMQRGELAAVEAKALLHSTTKPDAIEGGVAFVERRAPDWTGAITSDWPDWLDH